MSDKAPTAVAQTQIDTDEVHWPTIESGPVVVHPLRLKCPTAAMSMFDDDIWSLRPMDVPRGIVQNLHWTPGHREQRYQVPQSLRDPFKRIIWLSINRPAPLSYQAVTNSCTWLSAASIQDRFGSLRRFAHFLGEHGISQLREIDVDLLDLYMNSPSIGGVVSGRVLEDQELGPVAAIAHLADLLPATDRMVEPSWSDGPRGSRGRAQGADNNKAIIHPDTFAPLLWWSQQIVGCAPDIAAAVKWLKHMASRPRPTECSSAGLDAVGQIVTARDGVLPAGKDSRVAAQYLATVQNAKVHEMDFSHWRRLRNGSFATDPALPQPIPVPVDCTIEGRPWLSHMDFRDVREGKLQRVLQAAAVVLICSCTGMRGEECRKLERGALRTVPRPDGATSYRVTGRIFKGVRDAEDQQLRDGKPWVWATIKPGAEAIQALELLAEASGSAGLIAHPEVVGRRRVKASRALPGTREVTAQNVVLWILELIEFANGLVGELELGCAHKIDVDPAGNVTLDRFRRSIAWHIVNQPEGLLAAGVQFGHMKSTTTDGYGSTISSGMAATMDSERTRALYSTLQDHANAARNGLSVSGPAAKRLGNALNRFEANRFPGTYADLTKKEERRLRSDPDLAVRDNPGHTCLCVADPMKPETMACAREDDEPNRNDCRTYCGGRVYTDATIAEDRKEAAQLRRSLGSANPIMAARITKRIEHIEQHIAEHEAVAKPLLQIMAQEQAKVDRTSTARSSEISRGRKESDSSAENDV